MTAQPGLCRTRSETPKTGFLIMRLTLFKCDIIKSALITGKDAKHLCTRKNHKLDNLLLLKIEKSSHCNVHCMLKAKQLLVVDEGGPRGRVGKVTEFQHS